MAAKLQCEICGGRLVGKPGGIFECDSCGMEYDTAWAKAKIQEITGTVKVEGTVEVTGKVQVEGGTVQVDTSANKDALLKRAFMMLEERNWAKADELLEQVLNIDPECGEAYLGKMLAKMKLKRREDLQERKVPFDGNYIDVSFPLSPVQFYTETIRYGNPELKAYLKEVNEKIRDRNRAEVYWKAEDLAQIDSEDSLKDAAKQFQMISGFKDAAERAKACLKRAAERKKMQGDLHSKGIYKMARNLIVNQGGVTAGLNADGTVVTAGNGNRCMKWNNIAEIIPYDTLEFIGLKTDGTVVTTRDYLDISHWKDIVAVAAGGLHVVGLKADGTVVATGSNDCGQCEVSDWTDVIAIAAGSHHTVGLLSDGTAVATRINGDRLTRSLYEKTQSAVYNWKNIIAITADGEHTAGLRSDGTVVVAGEYRLQEEVAKWSNIAEIVSCGNIVYGLTADGSLKTTGFQRAYKNWNNIVTISCNKGHSGSEEAGIKADGTVISEGGKLSGKDDVSNWRNIISVTVGCQNTFGVKDNGRVIATKYKGDQKYYLGQDKVSGWKLFNSIEELEERYDRIRKARMALIEKNIAARQKRVTEAQNELANLRGVFTGKRRRELEEQIDDDAQRIAFMQEQLKKL